MGRRRTEHDPAVSVTGGGRHPRARLNGSRVTSRLVRGNVAVGDVVSRTKRANEAPRRFTDPLPEPADLLSHRPNPIIGDPRIWSPQVLDIENVGDQIAVRDAE